MIHPLPPGCSGGARLGETQNIGGMQHLAVPGTEFGVQNENGGAESQGLCFQQLKRSVLGLLELLGCWRFHIAKQ